MIAGMTSIDFPSGSPSGPAASRVATGAATLRSPTGIFLAIALLALTVIAALPARAEESLNGVALVIGQSDYRHIPALPNPANDAREMVKLLTDLGFDARSVSDRDAKKLARDLERFVEDAEGADVAFLYYSGHGIEAAGENFLVPVDADLSALDDAGERLVAVSGIIDRLKQTVPVSIVLLDACRTNPFPAGAKLRRTPTGSAEPVGAGGLTLVRGAKALPDADKAAENLGMLVGFAAEPGRPALDGPAGENSPYAAALLRHLSAMKGEEFGAVMRMVTEEVYLDTRARQRPWTNESLRRFLYFGVSPDEPAGDDALITGERRKLLLTISTLPDVNRVQVETAASKDGVPLDALYGVLKALGTENIPEDPTQLGKVLDAQAGRLKDLIEQNEALRTDDPEIARLSASADKAIREGAIATARKFLDDAVARVEANTGTVDQAETALKQRRLADAAVYEKRGDAAALGFDFLAAAADYGKAADLAERWDGKTFRTLLSAQATALYDHGNKTGAREALRRALDLYQRVLESGDQAIQTANRGLALNNYGVALQSLGEMDTDSTTLKDALDTYREALRWLDDGKQDTEWAYAQSNMGTVLLKLGEREGDNQRIRDAIEAFGKALEKQDRARLPRDWANTQNNIGLASYALAERETGAGHLVAAEAAYRLALEEFSLEKYPVEWALVQNNLGNTLNALGTYRNDPAKYQEAAAAFRAALEVRKRESFPRSWATSRLNLANALSNSTKFDLGTDVLEEAATALRDAQAVFTRKDFPVDWASAQNNLGAILQTLGQRRMDQETMKESASTFRAALRVYKRRDFPLDWAMTNYNIGNTLQLLGGMSNEPARYHEAVAAYRDSLAEYSREATPRSWALSKAALGSTLHWLSNNEDGTQSLKDAIAARREALEVLTQDNAPVDWANTQNGLGMSLINLGNRETTARYLNEAEAAFSASLKVFTRKAQPLQWAFEQNNLGDVHWNLASFGGGGKPEYERAKQYFELAKQGFTEAGYLMPIPLTDKKIALIDQQLAK